MQLSKRIPFDDPDVLTVIRGVYVLSNVLIVGVYLYVQSQINKKKGMSAFIPYIVAPVANVEVRYDHPQVRRAGADGQQRGAPSGDDDQYGLR